MASGGKLNTDATWLNLANEELGGDDEAVALAELLPHFTNIKTMYLNSNQISGAGARALAERVANLRLETFDIHGNRGIGDEAAARLAASFPTTIDTIYMQMIGAGDKTAQTFVTRLPNLTQLAKLYLSYNELSDSAKNTLQNKWAELGKEPKNLRL